MVLTSLSYKRLLLCSFQGLVPRYVLYKLLGAYGAVEPL